MPKDVYKALMNVQRDNVILREALKESHAFVSAAKEVLEAAARQRIEEGVA